MGWKEAVGKVAPILGMALVGNIPGAVASALGAIASTLGLPDSRESTVEAALRILTPEQAILLKRADQDFALAQLKEVNRANAELERLVFDDRANARAREIATKDNVPRNLAYALTVGFFGVLLLVFIYGYPEDSSRDLIQQLINTLNVVWIGCMAYYFGTTSRSGKKDSVIADLSTREK